MERKHLRPGVQTSLLKITGVSRPGLKCQLLIANIRSLSQFADCWYIFSIINFSLTNIYYIFGVCYYSFLHPKHSFWMSSLYQALFLALGKYQWKKEAAPNTYPREAYIVAEERYEEINRQHRWYISDEGYFFKNVGKGYRKYGWGLEYLIGKPGKALLRRWHMTWKKWNGG